MSQPFQMTSKSRFDPSSKQISAKVLNSYNEGTGQFNTEDAIKNGQSDVLHTTK
jgi:hypothetical protein